MRAAFLEHIVLLVRDLAASRAFYEAALRRSPRAPIAHRVAGRRPGDRRRLPRRALDAGGTDDGAPGRRPQYHDRSYAAYVLDPDGNNVEAVRHTGPTESEALAPEA